MEFMAQTNIVDRFQQSRSESLVDGQRGVDHGRCKAFCFQGNWREVLHCFPFLFRFPFVSLCLVVLLFAAVVFFLEDVAVHHVLEQLLPAALVGGGFALASMYFSSDSKSCLPASISAPTPASHEL